MKSRQFFTAILLLAFSGLVQAQAPSVFVNGDRVVFVGNSITDGGHYHSDIWLYYMTRFPDRRIRVFNAGIGGDVAGQINDRFEWDVAAKKPTVVAVTFGMNDTRYFEYNGPDAKDVAKKSVQTSYESYLKIEKKLQALKGAKKILMASSPYDESVKYKNNYFPGKSLAMLAVADFQQQAAQKNAWAFVDFNRPMTALNLREQAKDSLFSLCGKDRIHPDNDGHLVMAYIFLKAQGLAGKKVAAVSLAADLHKLTNKENCTISNLSFSGDGISFNYLAGALPYPVDTMKRGWGSNRSAADALSIIPFMDEFNQELFMVAGLKPEQQYKLLIDGQLIGSWTGTEWQKGINLAANCWTPQYQQALAIMQLNEERWEIDKRFRAYGFLQYNMLLPRGMVNQNNQAALDTLNLLAVNNGFVRGNMENYSKARFEVVRKAWENEMAVLTDEIYRINKPLQRRVQIVKAD